MKDEDNKPLIRPRSDHKKLYVYQKAEAIYDITFYFCHKYLKVGDRTIDQMIQAARSGKQNIVEGNAASSTSMEIAIKIINASKFSFKELLEDYEDYLRSREHEQWELHSKKMIAMRELGKKHNNSAFYMNLVKVRPPETIANMAICLINQVDYLLFRHLQRMEKDFLENGGMKEQMTKARLEFRKKKS